MRAKKVEHSSMVETKYEYNRSLYIDSLSLIQFNSEIYHEYSMADSKIWEIPMRIGYPYLFRHIDHCDHMIMVTDIRLQDNYDSFIKESDSLITYQKKIKRRICDACLLYFAKYKFELI